MYRLLVALAILSSCSTIDSTTAVKTLPVPSNYETNYVEVPGVFHPFGAVTLGTWSITTIEEPISEADFSLFKFPKDSICYYDSILRAFQTEQFSDCCFDTVAIFDNFLYKGYYFMSHSPTTPDSSMIPLAATFQKWLTSGKIRAVECE